MNTSSQYSVSFYKWLYWALIACSLNGMLQCFVFFTSKKTSQMGQLNLVLWIVIPVVLVFIIYHHKKSTTISYGGDGIRYKQGLFSKFIPMSQIENIISDDKGVTVIGKNSKILKKFDSKHYQDLSFLEQSFKQLR